MNSETVAIITTILNERNSIGDLLTSFLSQTRIPDEIIIVDGGSKDGTIDILKEYSQKNECIKFFIEPGVNIATGRNIAISHSNCTLIAATDGGCHPEKTWLEELIKPLIDNHEFGAVSGVRVVESQNIFELFAGLLSTSGNSADENERVFHGRNSAFRKSVWQETGGYPEWLYTAEDTLFAKRAKSLGCRVAAAPKAIISWRPRPNLKKLAKQYYLYGKGTGRIGHADLKAVFYHLRNHICLLLTFILGFLYSWLWLITFIILIFMYFTMIMPVLEKVKLKNNIISADFYVPVIVMVRSFFNNLGQLYGYWEYRKIEPFKTNLELYLSGKWKAPSIK